MTRPTSRRVAGMHTALASDHFCQQHGHRDQPGGFPMGCGRLPTAAAEARTTEGGGPTAGTSPGTPGADEPGRAGLTTRRAKRVAET